MKGYESIKSFTLPMGNIDWKGMSQVRREKDDCVGRREIVLEKIDVSPRSLK